MKCSMQFHTMPDGRKLAFRFTPGRGPALVFLPGYMSDMKGGKAQGRACLCLDYSGCGESEGRFAQGTLSRWRDEVLALIAAQIDGPVVLIGSSMGGWLMLLAGLAMPDRVAGLIGLAAAPDFTAWGFSDDQQAELLVGETVLEENAYGPQPTPTYPGFWADGQSHLLLGSKIALTCPVRLIQGQADPDVPWDVALQLAQALCSADVQVQLIKDGDHRLSRPADIALILRTVAALVETGD